MKTAHMAMSKNSFAGFAVKFGIITGIIALTVAVRLLPMKWGIYLDEYDPYLHFKNAKFIVENGFAAWSSWYDKSQWYPWGIFMPRYDYVGVAFSEALLYMLLTWAGFDITLLEVAVLLPVLMSIVAVLAIFFLSRELYGDLAGMFAAMVYALSPTVITRTAAGFADTESLGLPFFLLSLYFFVRGINRKSTSSAVLSGAFLGFMCASWGAYVFPLNLYGAVIIAAILFGKYDRDLAKVYVITVGVALAIASQVPLLGPQVVTSGSSALVIFAFLAIVVYELASTLVTGEKARLVTSVILAFAAAVGVYAYWVFGGLGGRLLAVIYPFAAPSLPVFATVGEHHPSSWGALYRETHYLTVLAIAGAVLLARRFKLMDLVVLILGLVSIYVGAVMIRLTVFSDIAVAILSSVTLSYLVTKGSRQAREGFVKLKKKTLSVRWQGVALLSLAVMLCVPVAYYGVRASDRPAAVASSAGGVDAVVPDWAEALAWMRDNLPANAVVGAWWDYGYWINVMANRTTLADNGTINSTQIRLIAEALLSDEDTALRIFEALGNVTHFVVFEPWRSAPEIHIPTYMLGDVGKSTAMMYIAGCNVSDYLQLYRGIWLPVGPKAQNATLYRLLYYPFLEEYAKVGINMPSPEHFKLVFASSNKWVLVYEVTY